MDPIEMLEYAHEGMKWLSVGVGAYFAMFLADATIPPLFSEKIKNQRDLDRITAEESAKLGLDKPVEAYLEKSNEDDSRRFSDGTYEIRIGSGRSGATRSAVRHELYHIHKGHFDDPLHKRGRLTRKLNYLLRQEPQAIAYGLFKLKL